MIADDPELQQKLWLVRNNIDLDVADALMRGGPAGQAEAFAWSVIFGTFEGGEFDWSSRTWKRQDPG